MEKTWQEVWRVGFAPLLSRATLEQLAEALRSDDERLIQGSTTLPPPLMVVQDWPAEGGCAVGFCGVIDRGGFGVATVRDCDVYFSTACFDADARLGHRADSRWFLNWFDNTPRDEMRRELLPEVERAIAARAENKEGGL